MIDRFSQGLGVALLCAGASLVGCAPAGGDDDEADTSADALTATLPASEQAAPSATTSPAVWACNFAGGGGSAIFLQDGRRARGALHFFEGTQPPFTTRGELTRVASSGSEGKSVSFKRTGDRVEFREGATLSLAVDLSKKERVASVEYPWSGSEPDGAVGGCWGPVR